MSWTTPRTWVTGEVVTAAEMNQQVRDNENFLRAFHGAKVYRTANQTAIATGTKTAVAYDNEEIDSDAYHDNVTNNSRFTIPSGLDGKYGTDSRGVWAATAAGILQMWATKNGATDLDQDRRPNLGGAQAGAMGCAGVEVVLNVGDYVEAYVQQNSGGNLDLIGTQSQCWFKIELGGS